MSLEAILCEQMLFSSSQNCRKKKEENIVALCHFAFPIIGSHKLAIDTAIISRNTSTDGARRRVPKVRKNALGLEEIWVRVFRLIRTSRIMH